MWIFSLEYQILNDFPSNVLIRIPFTFPPFLPGPAFVIIPAMQSSVWGQLAGIFDPRAGVRRGTRQGERVFPLQRCLPHGQLNSFVGFIQIYSDSLILVSFFFFFFFVLLFVSQMFFGGSKYLQT